MPHYLYEHENPEEPCQVGLRFTLEQRMADDPIEVCPACKKPIFRVITPAYINTPTADTDLRDKGFAKLVRRDHGVYENVTALDGESRYWDANKPETMPNIQKRISD